VLPLGLLGTVVLGKDYTPLYKAKMGFVKSPSPDNKECGKNVFVKIRHLQFNRVFSSFFAFVNFSREHVGGESRYRTEGNLPMRREQSQDDVALAPDKTESEPNNFPLFSRQYENAEGN
jgi:hypothetical protein